MHSDQRTSPAAQRNFAPICRVLEEALPSAGLVLEIASGSGQHCVGFAQHFPALTWQPSDPDPDALRSIAAWSAGVAATNLRPAVQLDVTDWPWPVAAADAIVCINMIHIAAWAACHGLMRGAGELLRPGGLLYMYGPMRVEGQFTAASNAEFDASLRARDPSWGVRDIADVAAVGRGHGLALMQVVPMPANNFSLEFRREG